MSRNDNYFIHLQKIRTLFAQNCIDTSIPFVRLSDSIGYVLELMQEYKTEILAVVDNTIYAGAISENMLLEVDDLQRIETLQEHFLMHKVSEGTHLFDVLKVSADLSVYFLPVVNSENEYIGIITPQKLLNIFAMHSSLVTSGGIIVLELETKNYSLTEISKIVESNNAMILHSMMATSVNQNFVQVSLKVNKNDLKDIQLAFERYQYTVLAVLHQSEYEVQLQERYDSLMKYLNV
ncbi:MAG TPA: CBS domain-containing protein [Chitinophagales bacterium]|nr:CBS domain-containing protein [Chitinophagales bacterium]